MVLASRLHGLGTYHGIDQQRHRSALSVDRRREDVSGGALPRHRRRCCAPGQHHGQPYWRPHLFVAPVRNVQARRPQVDNNSSCNIILGTGRLDIFSLSPPPNPPPQGGREPCFSLPPCGGGSLVSPSPLVGEGALFLPPPLWGRVGVGGELCPIQPCPV